jgi:hypothetical protein
MSTLANRLGSLERIRDLVREIRRANDGDDFDLATRLNERLGKNPEHLLKTRELADWKFSGAKQGAERQARGGSARRGPR